VLDGYPKNYDTAFGVFFIVPEVAARKTLDEDGVAIDEEIDPEELKQLTKPQF
jgi:hypothetical protein